jgi:hypothetical protein
MGWTNSRIFRQHLSDHLGAVYTARWNSADVWKAALYGAGITPDATVATTVLTAYNGAASQWVTGGEITDTNWAAGGRTITGTGSGGGFSSATSLVTFDGADTAGGGNVTLANVNGDLVYDSTVSTPVQSPGGAFHYYGGNQSVTAGTFTVQWNAAGIMQVTV